MFPDMQRSLERFITAQADPDDGWEAAIAELRAGAKRRHWIWYVLPQHASLGSSSRSRYFGLSGDDEAIAYLAHPILGPRYREALRVVDAQLRLHGLAPLALMGSEIDVVKLTASVALFGRVAADGCDELSSEVAALSVAILSKLEQHTSAVAP